MDVLAAVPVKDLVNAKQRLIPLLGADERRARAMLEDVLGALAARPARTHLRAPPMRWSWVAGATGAIHRRAASAVIPKPWPCPVQAVAGAPRFLTFPATSVRDGRWIALVCGTGGAGDGSGTGSGFGTNGALLAPPHAMPLKFGQPSFDNHLLAARQRGLTPVIRELPGLGLDIDTPEDLLLLLARGAHTRSATLVSSWHLPHLNLNQGQAR
jgi:hypothetical protein